MGEPIVKQYSHEQGVLDLVKLIKMTRTQVGEPKALIFGWSKALAESLGGGHIADNSLITFTVIKRKPTVESSRSIYRVADVEVSAGSTSLPP